MWEGAKSWLSAFILFWKTQILSQMGSEIICEGHGRGKGEHCGKVGWLDRGQAAVMIMTVRDTKS